MEDVRAMTTSLFVDDLGMLTATKRDDGWYIDWMVLALLMQIQAISPLPDSIFLGQEHLTRRPPQSSPPPLIN